MKHIKYTLLLIVLFLLSCSHIDKESKSFLLHKTNNTKIGLTEKHKGVMVKLEVKF